jgi:hypothetical protein
MVIETARPAATYVEAARRARSRPKGLIRAVSPARTALAARDELAALRRAVLRCGASPDEAVIGMPLGPPSFALQFASAPGAGPASFASALDARLREVREAIETSGSRVDDARCSVRLGLLGDEFLGVRVWRATSGLNVELSGSASLAALLETHRAGIAAGLRRRGVRLGSLQIGTGRPGETYLAHGGRGGRPR